MLSDRGYIVDDEEKDMDYEAFCEKYETGIITNPNSRTKQNKDFMKISREKLLYLTQHSQDPNRTIFVFFPSVSKLSVKHIKNFWVNLRKENSKRAIIILKEGGRYRVAGISTAAKRAIESMNSSGYVLEVFQEKELLINITKHELVPKHQPLNEKQKSALLKKYGLKLSQLPRVCLSDPISRYYGMQIGDVFKITRPSETAGKYVTYRIVVPDQ